MKEVHKGQVFEVVTPDYKLSRVDKDTQKHYAPVYAAAKSLIRFYWKKDVHFTIILRDSIGWRIEGSYKYYRTQRDAVYALVKVKGKPEKIK